MFSESSIFNKNLNTLCGQNVELVNAKSGGLAGQNSLTKLQSPCREGIVEEIQCMDLELRNKRSRDFKCCSRPACLGYDIGAGCWDQMCVLQRDQHVRMNDGEKNNSQNKKVTEEVKKIECETDLM